MLVIPGQKHNPVFVADDRAGICQQIDLPAPARVWMQQTQDNRIGPLACQLCQGQAFSGFSPTHENLVAFTGGQQLVVDLGKVRVDDVLNHQPADGGITGHHFHGPGVGPLDNGQFTHVLNFSHHKGQPGVVVPGLGGDRQQCLHGFNIGGYQRAALVHLAGHNHRRRIQTGNPMQRFRLNGRAAAQNHFPGSPANTRLSDQFVQMLDTGLFRQKNQPQFLGVMLLQKPGHTPRRTK